jgi:hypothetical protein
MLARPPTIDDKAFAMVDGQWRTAREIFLLIGEGAPLTMRGVLARLAGAGKIERRYDPDRNQIISRYRRLTDAAPGAD